MLKKILLIGLILVGSFLNVAAQDGFDYDKYKTRTLKEIVESNSDLKSADITISKENNPQADPQIVVYGNLLHSEVKVRFMNKSRPISAERKEIIEIWKKSFKIDEKIVSFYENEYLFKEGEKEYWIPVQKQVAEYFPKELKENDLISLFIIRVGGRKLEDGKSWDWLFLSTEFEK
jgi:hypothetical protein